MENEVKIHITTTDDTAAGRGKTREDFQKLGDDVAGDLDKKLSDGGTKAGKDMGTNTSKEAKKSAEPGGGMMATAIAGGLIAGGPVIGAAMAGIGALGLIALGAKLQAGAPQIQAAWGNLVNDAKVSSDLYSSVMVPPIRDALNQIDADLQRQGPVIQGMFSSAAADIPIFTNGLLSLTDNALPGFSNALSHSEVIMQGIASMMGSIGSGVSDIGNSVASSSGRIGSDMSSLGNIVHTVETGIGSLISITSGLAEGALPALGGAVGLVTGTLSGLHSLLGPIEPELGGIVSVAGGAYLAFSKLAPMADKLGTSMASKGGLLGSISGLAAGIPYVGAAVAGLSLVTGILASQNEKAAQAATDEAKSSDNLNKSLAGVTNATQAQIDGMVEQNAAGQSWLRTAQDTSHQVATLEQVLAAAGVSQNQFASAIENGGSQLTAMHSKLDGVVISQQAAYDSGKDLTDFQMNLGDAASALSGKLEDLAGAYQGSAAQAEELAIQTAQADLGLDHATLSSAELTKDMHVLGDATSTTSARTTALTDALRLMADHGAEPANDALAQAWSTVNGLGAALKGTTGKLLDTGGGLDLTTTKGEAAQTAFEQLRGQVAAYAQALVSQGDSSQEVRAKTDALIQQLTGPMAKALGLSQAQVKTLSDTLFGLNGANITATVGINTNEAYSALSTLLNRINNSSATVAVNIASGAAQHGIQIPKVSGGPTGLSHYDTGGATGDLTMNEHGGEAVRLPTGSMVIPNSSADNAARTAFERGGGGASMSVEMKFTGTQTAFSTFVMNEFRAGRIQLVANGQRVTVG